MASSLPSFAAHEFFVALCRPAASSHRAAESRGVCPSLRARACRAAHRDARRRSADRRISRSTNGKVERGAENPRGACQGAAQRAGAAAARRADRLARPRYRRLGAKLSRSLSAPQRRHHPARLAQHGRGGAAVLGGDDDAQGTHRRPRQPARADRALRPRYPRAGLPRHRPRRRTLRPAGSGAMSVTVVERPAALARFSPGRVGAMLLRYLYLLRSSWPRALELLYWPAIQMVLWGFTSQFLMTNSSYVARAGGVLLAAVMLWDVMFRGQLGVSVSFLEELWSRNLGHLFVSPLRPYEWMIALLTMSLIRVAIGVVPVALLAIPLYHYSIFSLGLPLLPFFVLLLLMGWG